MKMNKKALVAAVTLSMWAGCYGNASAETYLYGAEGDYSEQTVVEGKAVMDTTDPPTEGVVATGASFTVKGGDWSYVYGGYAKITGSEASVSGNTVTVTGGGISSIAYAGIACGIGTTAEGNANAAQAENNTFNINNYTNSSEMSQVSGGYAWSQGASCTVNGNKVNITNSQLKVKTVAAAYGNVSAGNSLTANNNTVELDKATVTGSIYGVYNNGGGTVAEATGNLLKVKSTDNSVGGIGAIDSAGTRNSFQAMNFELPADADGKTMLTSSAAVDLTGVSSFNVDTTNYTSGNTITLLSSANGITNLAENALKINGETATITEGTITVTGMTNAFRGLGYSYDKEDEAVKAIKFCLSDYYLTADSTVSQDVTLDVRLDAKNKSITIDKDKKLNANQGISNAGTITNNGTLSLGADSSLGSIDGTGASKITGGTTTVSGNVTQGEIKISEGACYKQTGGTAIWGAYFSNYGTVQFSLPGDFGIAPAVNGNGKTEILAGNVSANSFTQGELLVAEGAGFTCNESFNVDQITNNGTLSRGGASYYNTAGSINGTGTTSLTGTLTVNGNFTQKGLTVGEGGNYTQTAGHFVVNGDVTNSGTVTLQNLGGTATKDITAAENKVTGTLTNNGTFTLDNTNLTVKAFTGNTVEVKNGSKLTLTTSTPSGGDGGDGGENTYGGEIAGDLNVTSGSKATIAKPAVVHGNLKVDSTSTLEVAGTSLTAVENGARVTIGNLAGDGKGQLQLSAFNVMQEGLVDIGNASNVAINVAAYGATVAEGVRNLDDAIANINARGIESFVKNLGEGASFNLQEGAIFGETSYIGSASGKATKISRPNAANKAASDSFSSASGFGRIEMNDIRKRLGDVRLADAEDGVWSRYEHGKLQGQGITNSFNKIQLGADHKVSDKWRLGGAFSYTNGNSVSSVGHNDSRSYSLAAYGAYHGPKGAYADIIARVGKSNTDVDFWTAGRTLRQQGRMTDWSQAISAEMGKTYSLKHNFFVEPQAELSYTHSGGDDFTSNGYSYRLGSMNSLSGRLGFAIGYQAPDKKGALYTRFSVLHEFAGDRDFTISRGALSSTITSSGSDTWYEWAIGGQLRTSKSTYIYADLEKTFRASMDEKYRATVGLRYSF